MAYGDAIAYLYGLQSQGIKLGLEKTATLLDLVGGPHRLFRSVHVAGTNGKGSVSAMTASILRHAGFTVGLFTSPHLVSFTERIRVNDVCITEDEVVRLTDEIRGLIDRVELPVPTFFEFVTAMAFLHFARLNVAWAVIETGMGGRLDATNVITPAVTVITPIGMDHREYLGDTLSLIAFEKAGIIKQGVPVVSAAQHPEAEAVIDATCIRQSAPCMWYGRDFSTTLLVTGIEGTQFDYRDAAVQVTDLFVPLPGGHQAQNAALAIKASMIVLNGEHPEAVAAGLEAVRWRGRLEQVCGDPAIVVDGAHNPAAAAILATFLEEQCAGQAVILVLGVMADKDYQGIIDALAPVATQVIVTAPACRRAASPQDLAAAVRAAGFSAVRTAATVRDALATARDAYYELRKHRPALIVVTGSFYTAGEALEALGEPSTLSTLREWA